jgi:hypothetical protein
MIFDKIFNDIQDIRPYAIQARTFHDQTLLFQFYKKYGFLKNNRMMHEYLPLIDADLAPMDVTENKLNAKGIIITTLAGEIVSDANSFFEIAGIEPFDLGRLSFRAAFASILS